MTHFSQQDNFSVAARVLGALFYYAPESAEAAPLVAVLTNDSWETQFSNQGTMAGAALVKDAMYNGSLLIRLLQG